MILIKKVSAFSLSVLIFAHSAVSLGQFKSAFEEIKAPQQSSEFIFRSSPQEALISVQLLGAVNKPGIYYIPTNTDLLKLLTLAGGTTNGGDLSEILVRPNKPLAIAKSDLKITSEVSGAIQVDGEKLIRSGGTTGLKLHQDDFVYVPPRTPWISTEASRNITIGSIVLGMVLTSVLINKNMDQKK